MFYVKRKIVTDSFQFGSKLFKFLELKDQYNSGDIMAQVMLYMTLSFT